MKETVFWVQACIEALQRMHSTAIYLHRDPKFNAIQVDIKFRHQLSLLLKMALLQ